MVSNNGAFIVIDGSDGTGKKTQYQLLISRLEKENIAYQVFDFPQYGQPSAYFVEQYLGGAYGSADEVGPKPSSLFYAMDRFAAKADIQKALSEGKIVLANRFSVSNMGHQGAKLKDAREHQELYEWIDETEHETLGIPRPDLNLILSIPHSLAQANVDRRSVSDNRAKDIHEADPDFLRRSIDVYQELCELFPERCIAIDCAANEGEMKTVEAIHELIWEKIRSLFSTLE